MELEVTWLRMFSVWWLVFWRSLLLGVVAAFVLGFLIGLVGHFLGWPRNMIAGFSGILGLIAGVVASVVGIGMALRKRYRGFRIALISD